MGRIAAKERKKISVLVPSDGYLKDPPAVGVIPSPFHASVAELSSFFKKRRSFLLSTNMEKPRSSLPSTNMGCIAAKQPKKISALVPADGYLKDPPAVGVIPSPFHASVAELSSFFKKRRSFLLSTNMEKPKSSLPSTNMEKPSKKRGFIVAVRKLKKFRIRQTWAEKQYKKSHQGNGWKKPFAGSFHSKGLIVHEKMGIEAKQPNSDTYSMNSEEKELFHLSISHYLSKCGFSEAAKLLLAESTIKDEPNGAPPPDLEEIFSKFLRAKEIDASVQKLFKEPNHLVSSFLNLKGYLPATPDSSDPSSDPLLSKYTKSKVQEDSNFDGLFMPDRLLISEMPEKTTPDDVVRFFKKASIDITADSVELNSPKQNFTGVVTIDGDVVFKSPEDTKAAFNLNGNVMKVKKKKREYQHPVFFSKYKNDFRILYVSGLHVINAADISDFLALAFTEEKVVNSFVPDGNLGVAYVLILVDDEVKQLFASLNGRSYKMDVGDNVLLTVRETSMKPEFMRKLLSDENVQKMQKMQEKMQEEKQKEMQKKMKKKKKRVRRSA